MKHAMDKRTIRTKENIGIALLDLLAQKPVTEITVTELSEKAGINRKTFYAHYNNISDVMEESYREFCEEFTTIAELLRMQNRPTMELLANFLSTLFKRSERGRILFNTDNGSIFIRKLHEFLAQCVETHILETEGFQNMRRESIHILANYVAGGVVMAFFCQSGENDDPSKSVGLLSQAILNGVKSFEEKKN